MSLSFPPKTESSSALPAPYTPKASSFGLRNQRPAVLSVFGVEPRRIGGTETFARELSSQLNDRDWNSVLCFLSEPADEVRRFLDLPNVSFEVLPNSTDGNWVARHNLMQIINSHRPEILHLHYVSFLNFYSWAARVKSVRQVFFTDHHSRPEGHRAGPASLWKRSAARLISHPLTKVICVSNFGLQCMTKTGLLPSDRFEMIYNGVDLTRVINDSQPGSDFRRRYQIPMNRMIVTQVSWMIPEKGISDFLETAHLIAAHKSNVHFVLVGDGVNRGQYMQQAVSLGLANRITWTGTVADPFGEGVFQAADVVCQFSRWEEVFGWMIAEAMAHCKPVVGTRAGGIPELIDDGVSGYLVDRGDVAVMSERVLSILNDDQKRIQMGLAGHQIVAAKFDLRKNVKKLVQAYGI